MNILFSNTLLLPLLAIAALPLLLHLFSRTKPKIYRFSSNELLEKIVKKTRRIRKPQDILLLIVRTLLFAALAFMFLQPVIFADRRLSSMSSAKNIVIILDSSASMGYLDGGQTRFASACAEASEVLRGLSSRDKANIIYMKSKPEPVFPETGPNIAHMRDHLRRAVVSSEKGNVEAALRMASDMLRKDTEGIREVCIISDFQQTQWEDKLDLGLPGDIVLSFIKVGDKEGSNQAVARVSATPSVPLPGEEISFIGEIRNFSPSPERVNVFFRAGEVHDSTSLVIPAWGSATAAFNASSDTFLRKDPVRRPEDMLSAMSRPGHNPVVRYEFSISEDNFAEDNRRWGLLKISEPLKVGIVEYTPSPAESWRRGLSLFPWIELLAEHPGGLSANEEYDFLLLSGWDGSNLPEIQSLLSRGCVVVCSPAEGLHVASLQKLLLGSQESAPATIGGENAPAHSPFRMKIVQDKHRMFSLFSGGEHGDPVGALALRRLRLPERIFPEQETIIAFSDGVPALLQSGSGQGGKLFIWNIPLHSSHGNFARRVQFIPFMAEFILSSASLGGDVSHLADYSPGESIVFTPGFLVSADMVKLAGPGQAPVPFNIRASVRQTSDSQPPLPFSLVSQPVSGTGVYNWTSTNELIGCNVVNFPHRESDFRSISISSLKKQGASAMAGTGNVSSMRSGRMLWPWLLAAAVLLLLSEGLIMLWAGKTGQLS